MSLLIIRADLVNPPSTPLSFRDVTLYATVEYGAEICIETEDGFKDVYYRWMKPKGLLDFVKDILEYGEESGLRVDNRVRTYRTILTEKIVPENTWMILRRIEASL